MRLKPVVVALALVVAACPSASAHHITTCAMGGPTPGSKAIKLVLPQGADVLTIEPHGARAARPVSNSSNWHLVQGIAVINADTLELEAYRVESTGVSPRRPTVRIDGTTYLEPDTTTPDGPFYHTTGRPRIGLAPGTYYAVGFGSDGDPALPNDWWAGDIRVGATVSCAPIGTGRVFDIDQSEFQGGTHVYAQAAGIAEGMTNSFTDATADLVFGFMDVGVQLGDVAEDAELSHATLDYSMPTISGIVDDDIQPFASTGGDYGFTASYQGLFPNVVIAGVAVDLP